MRDIIEASPVARLAYGFDPNRFNTMFFTVFRRSVMTPWLNFCNGHPMPGPFLDFIHCWSLLAQGMVRCHQRGFYLWTAENWDTPDSSLRNRVRYYNAVGLPDAFHLFHDLHFAVEGLLFFLGEHSPITDWDTRIACAQAVWSRCMDRLWPDSKDTISSTPTRCVLPRVRWTPSTTSFAKIALTASSIGSPPSLRCYPSRTPKSMRRMSTLVWRAP